MNAKSQSLSYGALYHARIFRPLERFVLGCVTRTAVKANYKIPLGRAELSCQLTHVTTLNIRRGRENQSLGPLNETRLTCLISVGLSENHSSRQFYQV